MEYGCSGESFDDAVYKLRRHLCDAEGKFDIGRHTQICTYTRQREFAVLVATISYTLEEYIYTIKSDVKVSIECLYHTSDSKSYACIDVRIMGKSISMEHKKDTWITKEDLIEFVNCTIKEYIKNTTPFKEIGALYHQKGLLGDGIRRIALEMGIIHKDATPNGPELLMLVDNIIETITKRRS